MAKITELFGTMSFNDKVMKERLPQEVYKSLKNTMDTGAPLQIEVANIVATAMLEWAMENGATHYTHWFQPMTGITAEKHDSFIEPSAGGGAITAFSGKSLIKGESDASSFPSGGLRATFEARGYTAWDPTSYAFIKDNSLCIPTAFCSYGGEVLDKKTPLLRSMQVLSEQSLRILRLFGKDEVRRVKPTVGPEQEYFLIDRDLYKRRRDLVLCGRTLFGAKQPKGQELDDHYYGSIKKRVSEFMKELDEELWKLGIYAKTKHNEVAPSQHELAPIFTTTNIACDHNQLTMEVMKKVAEKHNLACLLHEKPFAGVNGSGKHNNWSLSTDTGVNLFEPGSSPEDNAQFLLFLVAVIKAVDEYADLMRVAVSSAGNDHRLGANEAPPAIVSIFLGDELTAILESIENDTKYDKQQLTLFETGATVLPKFPKDTTDRNRTSPFAFTGNKFEFRMLGSNASISGVNFILNTAVAEVICQFADILEKSTNFNADLHELIKKTIKEHKRVIFNGNGYSKEWEEEAHRRGLPNLRTATQAIPCFRSEKNVKLFTKHRIFTEQEINSRCDILFEDYAKVVNIEAMTMLDMVNKDILPAVSEYGKELAQTIIAKKSIADIPTDYESESLARLSKLTTCIYEGAKALDTVVLESKKYTNVQEKAEFFNNKVIPAMCELRQVADEAEMIVPGNKWPFPVYCDLLFGL
ncbi:MAG: glutamine synthetase III [Clostridia bacterium]|nr:glutamine synthetase III [Clostridia bacterium]